MCKLKSTAEDCMNMCAFIRDMQGHQGLDHLCLPASCHGLSDLVGNLALNTQLNIVYIQARYFSLFCTSISLRRRDVSCDASLYSTSHLVYPSSAES